MSALTLLFPAKPHELADDLESFVYLLLYCALRFHRHELTPAVTFPDTPGTVLLQLNSQNKALAKQVDDIFYDDSRKVNGYFTAGVRKESSILLAKVPISLDETMDGSPLLARLLQSLYDLLRRHYWSVDRDALACYTHSPAQGLGRKRPPKGGSPQCFDPFGDYGEELEDSQTAGPSHPPSPRPAVPQPLPRAPSPLLRKGANVARPLDNHKEIFQLFANVLKDPKTGLALDMTNYRDDKIFDQFDNLHVTVDLPVKNASSGVTGTTTTTTTNTTRSGTVNTASSSAGSSGSKRKLDQADLASPVQAFKRARWCGLQFELPLSPARNESMSAKTGQ